MFKTEIFTANQEGKFVLTKKQFKKMIPLEVPVHVGMNFFPHLYIQFVDIEGENVKILWDFSNSQNLPTTPNLSSYSWEFEFIISATVISKKKSGVQFIEYQKDETVIAIQV